MNHVFDKRHHDDETIDDVSIKCIPRFKTSGMSGDEWRVSYRVVLKRKGATLFDRLYTSLDAAITHLPWVLKVMFEGGMDGFDESAWERCHQVGCSEPATVFYRLKQVFADNGEGPIPSTLGHRTAFCARHSERGDCGREDADDNYEIISGAPIAASPSDESPSSMMCADGTLVPGVPRSERS